jgi:hypothetical protein
MGDLEWVKGLRQDVLADAKKRGLPAPPPLNQGSDKKAA